jgi:adenine-specific DNA methylase
LPAWPTDDEVAEDTQAALVRTTLEEEFPEGQDQYHAWFMRSIGILGDPVGARRAIKVAVAAGGKTKGNAYGYDRAFKTTPSDETVARLRSLSELRSTRPDIPVVLDPFAGGGSIPFEAARLGLESIANELNPVACAVLNGTVALPARQGPKFAEELRYWGDEWSSRVRRRLEPYFPHVLADERLAYIWAHTVPCPSTGRPTPLSPDYWLATGLSGRSVAVKVIPDFDTGLITCEIVHDDAAKEWGDRSTYKRGVGTSIWTGETFNGDYIREQAQAGRMGEMLLALSVSRPNKAGRQFRAPSQVDLDAVDAANAEARQLLPKWEVEDLIPSEEIPPGLKTREPRQMGLTQWRSMFTLRQLLTIATSIEVMREVVSESQAELGPEQSRALNLYFAIMLDKCVDYNSMLSSWDSTRLKVRNTFDRHDFSFKWSFAEFDGASALLPWAVDQVVDAYSGIANLVYRSEGFLHGEQRTSSVIIQGSATDLPLDTGSVDVIVTDPPYYDNVMYAECSDYFYVWLKRSLRDSWPALCVLPLTDKDSEAVANPSLFAVVATKGKGKKGPGEKSASDLADEHYEDLLTQSFREAHRVLTDKGVLTVMFTHKRIDAWDTLGQALLNAGFSINSSWPVHTESENSLHQAKKNSASSTIFLTCRKRGNSSPAYWTDIRGDVAKAAREAASEFASNGLSGIDLTISTFGPVLSVLSRNWPVYTGELDAGGAPQVLRPDVALDLAREEVSRLKKRGLLGGRDVEFDRVTDWYLLAWSDFAAAEFPYDEGRKLSLAVHLEMDDLAKNFKIVRASSGVITMLTPAQRRTSGGFDPEAASWPTLVDSLHALMLVYEEDGLSAAKAWLVRTGKSDDSQFRDLIEAALHAIPRVMDKGEFARPEAATLEGLRATLFDDIVAPVDPEVNVQPPAQLFELG